MVEVIHILVLDLPSSALLFKDSIDTLGFVLAYSSVSCRWYIHHYLLLQ